tara:strand:+ start:916 stop:1068 length:153 start_codon:yes stop_codon:yes gene_type:complete
MIRRILYQNIRRVIIKIIKRELNKEVMNYIIIKIVGVAINDVIIIYYKLM